jgi:hypothetical protein
MVAIAKMTRPGLEPGHHDFSRAVYRDMARLIAERRLERERARSLGRELER